MTPVDERISPQLQLLLQAIDALDAHGFTFWTMVEDDDTAELDPLHSMSLQFLDFPEEVPILKGEIELLASVYREILLLGSIAETK